MAGFGFTFAATSLTTIGLITMTKKATLTTAAALLLVGVGAIALVNLGDSPATETANNPGTASTRPGNTNVGGSSESTRTSRPKPRDPAENPEFVSKYGESRTNLSKQVATNVIGLLEDAVGMGELASTGGLSKAFGGGRGGLQMGLGRLGRDLKLTEEQQEKAAALYTDYQKRQLENLKGSVENLKKDPTALMQTLLASDAFSRGKITEDEYKQSQTSAAENLKGVINPLDRKNFTGGNPRKDETFNREFQTLLDPTQAETYQAAIAADQANPEEKSNAGDISNLPAMELEKLDGTVIAAKKMTSGLKQMMEGMGGLQDLGPLIDQQRKQQPPAGE